MLSLPTTLVLLGAAASPAVAHMAPWAEYMFGGLSYDYGDPVAPLGPGWDFDEWWFRGPAVRAAKPPDGVVANLPAGGNLKMEIACNLAWTTYGVSTTDNVACPGNVGAYHAGDPSADDVDYDLLAGCALGIADVDDINDVTMDNLVIFSVQKECVWDRDTSFPIPAKMPPCTSPKGCICGWFWEPNNGTGNQFMSGFQCNVTGSPADATPIKLPPKDPAFCIDDAKTCTKGPKRPVYMYNNPTNCPWEGNYNRPGYNPTWSFNDGPQNDIFEAPGTVTNTTKASSTPKSTTTSRITTSTRRTSVTSSKATTSTSGSFAHPQVMAFAHGIQSTASSKTTSSHSSKKPHSSTHSASRSHSISLSKSHTTTSTPTTTLFTLPTGSFTGHKPRTSGTSTSTSTHLTSTESAKSTGSTFAQHELFESSVKAPCNKTRTHGRTRHHHRKGHHHRHSKRVYEEDYLDESIFA
ncbi:hypothetical protein T439DRAFT_353582 [Meredithblackwellia eburnea MCA 4105]